MYNTSSGSTDFISILLSLTCIFIFFCVPLILLGWVIYFVFFRKNKTVQPENDKILVWLKQKKSEGLTTIDQLIDSLSKTVANRGSVVESIPTRQNPKISEKIAENKEENPESHKLQSQSNWQFPHFTGAEVLLYLGSFLIIFAMLVLVALGWESISGVFKFIILLFTFLGLLVAGLFLAKSKTLSKVGITYLTVSSFLVPLTLLGFWNFILAENSGLNFNLYWVFTSILSIIFNVFLIYFISRRRFFYLVQVSIYSLIISLSFTLTNDGNFRIVIIAVLNLAFYLTENLFKSYSSSVKLVSRIVNTVLNFMILLTVMSLMPDIKSDYEKILATLAMFIPTLFIAASQIKDKSNIETGIEFVLFIFKVIIACNIFKLGGESTIMLLGVFSSIYMLKAEYIFSKRNKFIFYEILSIVGLITFFASSFVFVDWMSPGDSLSSYWTNVSLVTISLINILFIPIRRKQYLLTGLGLAYLIFILSRFISSFTFGDDIRVYIYTYLVLGIVVSSAFIYFRIKGNKNFELIARPSGELLLGFAGLFSLFSFNSTEIFAVYAILSVFYFVRSILTKERFIKLVSYLSAFVAYSALLHVLSKNGFEGLNEAKEYSLFFIIPSIGFFITAEIRRFLGKKLMSEEIAVMLFTFAGVILALVDKNTFWIQFLMLFAFAVTRVIVLKSRGYAYISFVLFNALLALGLNILDVNFTNSILIISITNLFVSSLSLTRYLLEDRNNFIYKLLEYIEWPAIIYAFILILVTWFDSGIESKNWIFTLLFVIQGLNIALSSNRAVRKLTGIPMVLAVWNVSALNSANLQFYIIPVTIYGLTLASLAHYEGKKGQSETIEVISYIFQMFFMLSQSVFVPDEMEKIIVGISLIAFSSIIVLWGLFRRKKSIWITAIVFMLLELVIRLYVVIQLIPWWAYVAFIGLAMIALASYIIYRTTLKSRK